MANLALITDSTTHAAAVNTKAALELLGHTVTFVGGTSYTTHDFDPYDAVVCCRYYNGDNTLRDTIKTLVDGGKPVVIGGTWSGATAGTGLTALPTRLNLTGTWEVQTNASGVRTHIEITNITHPITKPFFLNDMGVVAASNFNAALDDGAAFVGAAYGKPGTNETDFVAGQHSLIAIESGTANLDSSWTPSARIVLWGQLYAGQSDYTGNGKFILKRCVNWALGLTETALNGTADATWNPLDKGDKIAVKNNDLTAYNNNSSSDVHGIRANLGKSTGKFYFECSADNVVTTSGDNAYGLATLDVATSAMYTDANLRRYSSDGNKASSSVSAFGGSYVDGAIVGVAVDLDAGQIWFSKDGIWQASGDPAGGTNPAFSDMTTGVDWYPYAFLARQYAEGTARLDEGRLCFAPPTGFAAWVAAPAPPQDPTVYEAILDQRWVLPATAADLARLGQQWVQNATQGAQATVNQRWSQPRTIIDQGWFNQRWGLFLSAPESVALDQTWALEAALPQALDLGQQWGLIVPVAHALELGQQWGLIVPVIHQLDLVQQWDLLAFDRHLAILGNRYRLEVDAVWQPVITAVHFTLILTGAADGTTDLILPMSSFQGRLRSGTPSYLAAIVPNASAYADAIDARPNGELVISRGDRWTDGRLEITEIARANLETIRYDLGPRSASATLAGHKTVSYAAPKTVALVGASYRAVTNGLRRYRSQIDNTLRPGDTAEINGESLVVREIGYTVGPELAFMEIAE